MSPIRKKECPRCDGQGHIYEIVPAHSATLSDMVEMRIDLTRPLGPQLDELFNRLEEVDKGAL